MKSESQSRAEFLHQERVDNAVKGALRLDSDDLAFLKSYADGLALSIELIFSDGGWWLPQMDRTGHLVSAVLGNRRSRKDWQQP